ncbi:uncharacterized protein [Diadema antillarum]|uniref:uncharacterized protein n=1 Tax=Diadema antillarum TaxID=105358 RepID=UPI003A88567C
MESIDNCQSFETGTDLSYNWVLPRLSSEAKFVKFEVRAEYSALIALSRESTVLDAMYEIELGSDLNSRAVIRRCHKCDPLVTENTLGRISGERGSVFWILFYQGILAIGLGDSLDPFLVWVDPQPLEVNHVGFTTDGVAGYWTFARYPGVFTSHTTGDACILYPFEKLPKGDFEINFALKWSGTTALQLAEEQKSDNCYYIVLERVEGGTELAVEIRLNEQSLISVTYKPVQSLDDDTPAHFYLKFEDQTLKVGEKNSDSIAELTGVNSLFLRYLGYLSFISDAADWYFFNMIPNVVGKPGFSSS